MGPLLLVAAGAAVGVFAAVTAALATFTGPVPVLAVAVAAGWCLGHGAAAATVLAPHPVRLGRAGTVGRPGGHARMLARRRGRPLLVVAAAGVAAAAAFTVADPAAVLTAAGWGPVAGIAAFAAGIAAGARTTSPPLVAVRRAVAGARAEESVAAALTRVDGVVVVANSVLVGAGGDVDHVVLGRHGVAVVETKAGRGRLRVDHGRVFAGRRPVPGDPVAQIRRQATAVARLTGRPVHPVVCVADATGTVTVDGVVVCGVDRLTAAIAAGAGRPVDVAAAQTLLGRLGAAHRNHR